MEKFNLKTILHLMKKHHKITYNHMVEVAELNRLFGIFLGLDEVEVNKLYISGLLHDVGKFYIPNEILSKKGALTDEEFNIIKKHPSLGLNILSKTDLGEYECYRTIINNVAYTHHVNMERSYPETKVNKSFYSEVTSITDCYHSLISKRDYKKPFTAKQTQEIMINSKGYNQELLSSFIKMQNIESKTLKKTV